jgi:membrane-anchored protein YejM (alkaline phosphatase superfamily)
MCLAVVGLASICIVFRKFNIDTPERFGDPKNKRDLKMKWLITFCLQNLILFSMFLQNHYFIVRWLFACSNDDWIHSLATNLGCKGLLDIREAFVILTLLMFCVNFNFCRSDTHAFLR